MKKFSAIQMMLPVLAILLLTFEITKAQNVGIGTNTPDSSAQLDVSSTSRGFLPPRMTFAQRNAINHPAQGLMIYCTDCGNNGGEPQYYNGSSWLNINGNPASTNNNASISSVTIGTQIWSTKNLNVVTYRNGDTIPQVTDPNAWANLTTGAWCWYNNDSTTYAATFGRLYNWFAVNDPRGLAPAGWHVPSNKEWDNMTKQLDQNVDTTCLCRSGTTIGSLLKNSTGWNEGGNGVNISGFSGLPAGYRNDNGSFVDFGNIGIWWTSTEFNVLNAWYRNLYFSLNDIYRGYGLSSSIKPFGFSVRIVRDAMNTVTLPDVSTTAISNISETTALSGGNVTNDGGASVTARGVCWSTSTNPTIALSTKTVDGAGTGAFTSSLTGLTANTTYYVRAYATNSLGTSYGTQISFTTNNISFVNLPSVTIGTQIWSSKNLDVRTYRNGDLIPQVTDPTAWANLTTGAWCWYNNDSATYAATYGRLYNWYAVNDPRGLAPQGWHVPTNSEWDKMTKYLDASVDTTCNRCFSGTTIGTQLKNTSGWNGSGNGTNSSGFASLPGGDRDLNGAFFNVGNYGLWWSASEFDTPGAWYRYLYNNSNGVSRYNNNKTNGFSVRVVRD